MNHSMLKYLIAAVGVSLMACNNKTESENVQQILDTPIVVTLGTPQYVIGNQLHVTGQIEAAATANISTKVMGYITTLKVKTGDRVQKGQLLLTISSDDISAKKAQVESNINEAEAALRNAQKDVERFTELHKQRSATDKELENVTLQYQSLKAKLEMAKQMRNEIASLNAYTQLTAPFSGTVTQKFAEVGSMANPGMPILTIENNQALQVGISVPENNIAQLTLGDTATVFVGAVNRYLKGTITQIYPSSQTSGGQYLVKLSISNNHSQSLLSGMYADVAFANTTNVKALQESGVFIPIACIEKKNQLNGIYTVGNNQTALLRWIKLGKIHGNMVEVLSGLTQEELFVVQAEGKLYNGATIKVK